MEEVLRSLSKFGPELALTAGLLLVVLLDAFRPPGRDALNKLIAGLAFVVALLLCVDLSAPAAAGEIFSGMAVVDPLGTFFKLILIAASFWRQPSTSPCRSTRQCARSPLTCEGLRGARSSTTTLPSERSQSRQ